MEAWWSLAAGRVVGKEVKVFRPLRVEPEGGWVGLRADKLPEQVDEEREFRQRPARWVEDVLVCRLGWVEEVVG